MSVGLRFWNLDEVAKRRVCTLDINTAYLLEILRSFDGSSAPELAASLPDDARVVGVAVLDDALTVRLTIESASYPVMLPGQIPPSINVYVNQWNDGLKPHKTDYEKRTI